MAKHSSFKNLVALEACQNFFLLAGISATSSLSPARRASVDWEIAPANGNPPGADVPPHQVDPTPATSD